MNQEEFIKVIKIVAIENVAKALCTQLANPAGKNPGEKIKQMSASYHSLSEAEKIFMNEIAVMAADLAVYNILGIIDGSIQIEDGEKKGALSLIYQNDNEQLLINDPATMELTSIFKSQDNSCNQSQ